MTRQENILGHRQCIQLAERCRQMNDRPAAVNWLWLAGDWRGRIIISQQYEQAAQDAIADHHTEAQAVNMNMWE